MCRRTTIFDWHRWAVFGAVVFVLGVTMWSCVAVAETQQPADPAGQFMRWLYPPPPPPPPVMAPPLEQIAPIVRPTPPKGKPKPKPKPKPKQKAAPKYTGLPPCSVVIREYNRMTLAERWAAYMRATPEQVAHGRRCLGM